jgi:hypothetical protein
LLEYLGLVLNIVVDTAFLREAFENAGYHPRPVKFLSVFTFFLYRCRNRSRTERASGALLQESLNL